jgi:hypothetical protein
VSDGSDSLRIMTTTSDDSFRLGTSWGAMLADANYDDNMELPTWILPAFLAMGDALEELPAEHRDPVISAAVHAWAEAENEAAARAEARKKK